MQIVLNFKGYEVFFRATKKPPIPSVIFSEGGKVDTTDLAEMFRYYQPDGSLR